MKAMGANWRIESGGAQGEHLVSGGGAGIGGAGGDVYLALAGGFVTVVVGAGGVDVGERVGEARYTEDAGMEGGQSLGGDTEGGPLLHDCIAGNLRSRAFLGNAAAIAGASDRTAAVHGVSCFLFTAAGGTEFVFDQPVAELL